MIYVAGLTGLLVGMGLTLLRALLGPSVFDRILALNLTGTLTVLLIALIGFYRGQPDFLDIAIAYALINFVGTLAVLKYLRFRDLGMYRAQPPQPVERGEQIPRRANPLGDSAHHGEQP